MDLLDTIAAVSTPRGKGGVAVIRISGDGAFAVAERVFFPRSGKKLLEYAPCRAVWGDIRALDEDRVIDDGLAVCFKAPRSFTGEDVVEISCHGGVLVTERVLAAVLAAGARPAEAGEFTRRAFVAGKLDLTEAEALGNLLEARTEGQLRLARNGMAGRLGEGVRRIYDSLRRVMSGIYAVIDFPDEDLSEMTPDEIKAALSEARGELARLKASYRTGRAINEGIPTAIVGKPNAGKSSVYNRIVGYDAAIVTEIEGTTRDVLRETATMGKTTLLLCDTAGIRETEDRVESIGIRRAYEAMESAGLVLCVFDLSCGLTEEDRELARRVLASEATAVALLNKTDGECAWDEGEIAEITHSFSHSVMVSAKSGEGFDSLAELVDSLFIDGELDMENDAIVTGARQYASVVSADEALTESLASIEAGLPMDLCSVGIESAMSALGGIDGRLVGEEIVAEIFSRFCVGK